MTVEWTPCSLYAGANDGRAECATVQMPLFWQAHDGRTFTVTAMRLLSSEPATGQLWLLHGGPGASGVMDFPPWMERIQADNPGLDVYTLDPRGTGYSEYAGCPFQEAEFSEGGADITAAEVPACIEYLEQNYGDKLATVGTTSAAYDLAAFIHHTREPDKKVLIWGGSGGTFWAQRYLQIFPDGADGVVLEGIEPADGSIGFMDEAAIHVGREILLACRQDAVCASKLPDPEGTLSALYDKLDAGYCPLGLSSDTLRAIIDVLSYYGPQHGIIPSLIYRLDRCNNEDINAIVQLFDVLFSRNGEDYRSFSLVLCNNEMYSELWEHKSFADNDAFLEYLDGVYEDDLIGTGKGYLRNEVYLAWPKYEDPLDDQWAQTDVPILMLQGVLDPATPHVWALTMTDHFDGPHQTFLSFPYAAHNVQGGTPYEAEGELRDCGMEVFYAFLSDPLAQLDSSCVEKNLPIDFTGEDGLAAYFYGTADFFENVAPKAPYSYRSPSGLAAFTARQLARKLRLEAPELAQLVTESLRCR